MVKTTKVGKAIVGGGIGLAFLAVLMAPAYVFIAESWETDFYYTLGSALFVAFLVGISLALIAVGLRQKVKPEPEDQPAA